MADQVRLGVISTSWWADVSLLPNLKSHRGAQVVAICGRNRQRAEEMARKYAIPSVYGDYRRMIEGANLHALVIAPPDDLHYPQTMDALDAGLHVLCEKPLAMNGDQARAMYEKAEAAGVKHMTFFSWRFMPHFQHVRDLVAAGYLGRAFHANFHFLGGYGREQAYAWRFDRRRANGVLGDLGSHMIDLARLLVGEISRVSARLTISVDRPGPDGGRLEPANDAALLLLEFANGASGMLQASAVAHLADRGGQQHVSLYGESGTLEVDVSFAGTDEDVMVRGARHDEERFQVLEVPNELWGRVDRTQPFLAQLGELFTTQPVGPRLFVDAILEDCPVSPSFYDGWKAQEVVDAALESDRTGCWETVR